jgi:sporulation protein YlmC with PRC-barrel domain
MMACELLEDAVVDGAGTRVGTIEELLIDVRAGAVAYAVVACTPGERIKVPWTALRFDAGARCFVLEEAPALTR